MVQDRR